MSENSKLIHLRILQILQRYSDANHPLSQKDIQMYLDQEYGLNPDRGAVRRSIHELMQAEDIPIEGMERAYSYKNQLTKNEETGVQYTDIYYRHEFEPSELHMLMDGVLFSRNIPARQREDLLNRLALLGGKYFHSSMRYLRGSMPDMPELPQLFLNIEILDEAIRTKKQVRMEYGYFSTNYQLEPAWPRKNDEPYWIILNPYRLAALDGRYFLICNNNKYDTLSIFRIDRMICCELLDTPAKPQREVKGMEKAPNTSRFVLSNAYMGYGESGNVIFTIPEDKAYEVIDIFGKTVSFKSDANAPEMLICSVYANYYSMKHWALQYADFVKVLSPISLVEEIKSLLSKGLVQYQGSTELDFGGMQKSASRLAMHSLNSKEPYALSASTEVSFGSSST